MLSEKVSFSINKYSTEEISDSQLMKLRMWIVSDGENPNKLPITLDAIKNAEKTLLGKPVLYKYDKFANDFEEHNTDEISCGFFPEINNITYEEQDNGKTFLVADAIIWKYYYPEVVEIFENAENNEKNISMEIEVLDGEKLETGERLIKSFVFLGVTLLGSKFQPGIESAKAKVLKFSELVKETEDILNKFVETGKDENVSNVESNKEEQVMKDESQIDLSTEDNPVDDINNIQDTQKEELPMKFNKAEFAEKFGLTANELYSKLGNLVSSTEKYSDDDGYEWSKYILHDHDDKNVFAWDTQKQCMVAIPYSIEDNEPCLDLDNLITGKLGFVPDEEDDNDDMLIQLLQAFLTEQMTAKESQFAKVKEEEIKKAKDEEKAKAEKDAEEKEAKMKKLEEDFSKLNDDFTQLQEESVKKDELIKEFTLEKTKVEAKDILAKKEYSLLTDSEKEEFVSKVAEYEDLKAFEKDIKAFAFEKFSANIVIEESNKAQFSFMAIPNTNVDKKEEKESDDVFVRLEKNLNKQA